MKNMTRSFISKAGKGLAKIVLLGSVLAPVAIPAAYAAETAIAPVQSQLRVGESHGGGKVAYIFKHGDRGYVSGQTHGLIAAKEDLTSATWEKALEVCKQFRGGGFSDWRLPSKDELTRLYENRNAIGGFVERYYYWSSTESDKNDAWDQSFRTGAHNLGYKLDSNFVRPVRSF